MAKPLKSGRCWCGFALQSMSDAYRRDDNLVSPIGHQLLYALLRPVLDRRPALAFLLATGTRSPVTLWSSCYRPVALYINFPSFTRSSNPPTTSCASFPVAQDYLTPQASCGSGQKRIRIIL